MEWNFTLRRIAVFIGLLLGIALLEFTFPSEVRHSGRHTGTHARSLLAMLAGAFTACFADHYSGIIDRTNFRPAYIFIGLMLIGLGLFMILGLRGAA